MFVTVDQFPLATSLAASCSPGSVEIAQQTTCTATATDPGGSLPPSGTVNFSSAQGSFGSGGTCSLSPSGSAQSSCSLTYTPATAGTQTIAASMPANNEFLASNTSTSVDAAARASSTTVRCSPANVAVGQPSPCTATVSDTTGAGTASPPSGSVTFSAGGGTLGSGGVCALTPLGPRQASCSVTYTPATAGTLQVSGDYPGDGIHLGSSNSGQVIATKLIGAITRNAKKGTARLIVVAPGPGAIALAGRGVNGSGVQASGPGELTLRVRASGKAARKLRQKGRTSITPTVTFTPPGGFAVTEKATIVLVKGTGGK
jgi:hypothetical protein